MNSQNSDASQRQHAPLPIRHLQAAPTVRDLQRNLEPVRTDDSCESVLVRFLNDGTLYALPVVDDSFKPVELVERKQYIEFFSRPYTRELFNRSTIIEVLAYETYINHRPIVVEDSCSVEDIARIILDGGMQHMVTGFIVCNQGRYVGIANGHDLLNSITHRKQAEHYYLAHYDSLTGIPNRMLLNDRLHQACRDADRKGGSVAFLFIDIDRFKHINDSFGHSAGDAVLCEVVARLSAVARRTDTVARLSGDEFVVLMEDLTDPADVNMVAQRLVHSMRDSIKLPGNSVFATVSVGSAIYPGDGDHITVVQAKADAAMYEAKASGGNAYRQYSMAMTTYAPATMLMENELRQAIERDELVLHFQPQVEIASQKICGLEVLVRWQHPVRGLIPPMEFIPIAEKSGLIVPLGEWVLRQTFRQLKLWQKQGMSPPPVAVNISAMQFRRQDFTQLLKALLTEYEVDPTLVELELTESVLMQNAEGVLQTLQEIKALGVSLAIDDFGTGFSSLSYLSRFPINRLKIDQIFVRNIKDTPVNESICRAILALANSLSLDIVAEGIENASENAALKLMGCPNGQGYLFAKPMSGDDLVAWFLSTQAVDQRFHFGPSMPL